MNIKPSKKNFGHSACVHSEGCSLNTTIVEGPIERHKSRLASRETGDGLTGTPIYLLSFWIVSTILVVLVFFLFILLYVFLGFRFVSQSIGVAGVCMSCLSWPSTQRLMAWHVS